MKKRSQNYPAHAAIEIDSDALRANLRETATVEVAVDPSFAVLSEAVTSFQGIRNSIDSLLYEVSHPFHNWLIIIPKLRAFVLKNLGHYLKHERGPEAFDRFNYIFISAALESKKNEALLAQTFEALLAYMEKLVNSLDRERLLVYEQSLAGCFSRLLELEDQDLMYIVQGQHPMKKISARLLKLAGEEGADCRSYDFRPAARLLKKILTLNYSYWLAEEDPLAWFNSECGAHCEGWQAGRLFYAISRDRMREHLASLNSIEIEQKNGAALESLLQLPAHMDIVRLYKEVPAGLLSGSPADRPGGKSDVEDLDRFGENRKLLFLFRIMETPGLYLIHEETLREINRSLVLLIRKQSFEEIEKFLLTAFQLLKANVRKYPHTSMQCIQVLGTEVFNRGNSRLVETFLWETVRFGFQYANVTGVDEDWQPITNPAHLANIRVWLNLIMQEPKWCATLFSALIINLKLSGTCVRDTDLFQRDITKLLNHPIEPIYNLAKQFTKLMPVFFNEIGAEGLLRDVSTELDETHKRKDVLIHFLRKQSHVESSNLIVDFIRAILDFWATRNRELLTPFLPEEVLAQVRTDGPFIDDLHQLMQRVRALPATAAADDLLDWDDQQRRLFLSRQQDLSATEIRRFDLLVSMYKLQHQKYNLGFQELRRQLLSAAGADFPEMEELLEDLEICDTFQCLNALLNHLEKLRRIILSDEQFEARENIYYKRHIAVDIPSVYGRYSEKKFDALGLTFRLENLANLFLEKLPATVNLSFITRATFIRIIKCLRFYLRALKIDGITSRRLETQVALLSNSLGIKRFSFTQYMDILRNLSEGVKDIIYAYYTNIHQGNFSIVVPQIGRSNLLTKYRALWDDDDISNSVHRLSEAFFRNLIAGTFGLQHLDNFITRIIQTLDSQKDMLDEKSLDLLMTYNPENAVSSIYHSKAHRTQNLIHLGNKGYNLTLLANDRQPVPPGFIITTELFRCWPVVKSFNRARDDFMRQLREQINEIENTTGRKFGYVNPREQDLLLLSVRSGAAITMPGMMSTINNVGLNIDSIEEYVKSTGKEYQTWDNYRRFLQSWAMATGAERDSFQKLMDAAKKRHKVEVKREFSPAQMKELALEYKKTVSGMGIAVPEDPWVQLVAAVELVLNSWNSNKARNYRSLMDASDSWGTAVIVQAMVYGNIGPESGSGVVFTAHPYRKVRRVALWGDYAFSVQGEDIVSGLVTTYPISVEQAEIVGRKPANTLEKRFPDIYYTLLTMSRELVYNKRWNPQEIEFTFESPRGQDLYILQTRDMITIKKKENLNVFVDSDSLTASLLGRGIGVSGSALSGRAVFTEENIRRLREKEPSATLILIRQDTVPEDIKEISMAEGLITARGGQTSHASVVATQLEKTCVVGCKNLKVYEAEQRCEINGHTIGFGDEISIDGRQGLFLKGTHLIKEELRILPI